MVAKNGFRWLAARVAYKWVLPKKMGMEGPCRESNPVILRDSIGAYR